MHHFWRSLMKPTLSTQTIFYKQCARIGIVSAVLVGTIVGLVSPSAANFQLCNTTPNQVSIALGYKNQKDWVTTGWWSLGPHDCEILLQGKLSNRFYYVRAVDLANRQAWAGNAFMCASAKEFMIRGAADCSSRGYERAGFFEVDTRDRSEWTVQFGRTPESRSSPAAPNKDLPLPGRGPE